ncbi:DNA-binding protein HEXBP [Trachymyrmex zeteki]|uniref:DNA-binding protein HEXBP n=1 Tax=Mycetomoellerius zeteki TaxID=64791 RepID=A0A151XJE4_9HYME|nr:DNA-binding protein HEXBP [Trachymyrmex zeteki]
MCKCFIRGLKPEIEQRIAKNLGVQETVADALRIERELKQMTDLRQGPTIRAGPNLLKDLASDSTASCQICHKQGHIASECRKLKYASGIEILICQICKKRGHSADKCRLRDPCPSRLVNVLQSNIISCQLCSKPGHNAKTCRNNNNVNFSLNKNSTVCQWCDKSGHLAANCWQRQNSERNFDNKSKIICHICNNPGHIARDCRSKINSQDNSKDSIFCRYCKETGHLLEACQLRIASINNRRKTTQQGNSDGPSKTGVQQGSERISHPSTSQKGQ